MKRMTLFFFILIALQSQAQQHYRFSVGGGFHSLMYWGLRSFEDVESPNGSDYFKIYDHEKYKINYADFCFAKTYKFNFGVNWFSKGQNRIHQSFSFYKGNFTDRIDLTLTEASGISENYYPYPGYSKENTGIGARGNVLTDSKIAGVSTEVSWFRNITRNVSFGAGLGVSYLGSRDDRWQHVSGYSVIVGLGRATFVNTTVQALLSLCVMYEFRFLSFYMDFAQHVFTLKKEENKGHAFWYEDFTMIPISHNFDYRFPLTIETGITCSFDRIRRTAWGLGKSCNYSSK